MKKKLKYKFLATEIISIVGQDTRSWFTEKWGLENLFIQDIQAQRIQALIDIPRYNVKAGDIGGYISSFTGRGKNRRILSDTGDCWIARDAIAVGNLTIEDDSLLTDYAVVQAWSNRPFHKKPRGKIKDNSIISGESYIWLGQGNIINGNSKISDSAKVLHATMTFVGASYVFAPILITNTSVLGNATIIMPSHNITGSSFYGDVTIEETGSPLQSVHLGDINHLDSYTLLEQKSYNLLTATQTKTHGNLQSETESSPDINSQFTERLEHIEQSFNSYHNDIVKLIKYPLFADVTHPDILSFVYALNESKYIANSDDIQAFVESVKLVEKLFFIAESKARTALDTHMDIKGQSKLKTASRLLSIAYDEGSTENEKKISCERVLKELRGTLPLGDILIHNLKATAGLKEIESFKY